MTTAIAHDTKPNILQRLHATMGEVDYIQKDKKAGMKYSVVSHDVVTAKVRPLLVKHGVIYYPVKCQHKQDGNRTEARITIRFCNVDDPIDFIDVESLGYGLDDQDKGPGKAISYATKYALLKALGLETGDDPDEDQVSKHKPGTVAPAPVELTAEPAGEGHPAKVWANTAAITLTKIATAEALTKWKVDNKANIDALALADANMAATIRGQVRALGATLATGA